MQLILRPDLVVEIDKHDLMIYRTGEHSVKLCDAVDSNYSLYNCIEILSFKYERHFISSGPYE